MKLETINGKEYFVKLKELEMNDEGEFVMRPIGKELFDELSYIPKAQMLSKSENNNIDKI